MSPMIIKGKSKKLLCNYVIRIQLILSSIVILKIILCVYGIFT